ncbi:MAG: response regulator [Oligoflexales bacterium]|nr:response regulator [Oligoflexales bacterium]
MPAKILVIDDSRMVQEQLRKVVQSLNCECIIATSGKEGIEKAAEHRDISIIIADINMEGMNGIDMCAEIRKMPHHKRTGIIMCTTEGANEMKQRGKELGVFAWVIKPVKEETFSALIRRIMYTK